MPWSSVVPSAGFEPPPRNDSGTNLTVAPASGRPLRFTMQETPMRPSFESAQFWMRAEMSAAEIFPRLLEVDFLHGRFQARHFFQLLGVQEPVLVGIVKLDGRCPARASGLSG